VFAKAAWLCVLATAGLLVWGAIGLFAPGGGQEKGNALIGEETERDLGQQPVGTHVVELRVRNTSRQPRRILGLPDG